MKARRCDFDEEVTCVSNGKSVDSGTEGKPEGGEKVDISSEAFENNPQTLANINKTVTTRGKFELDENRRRNMMIFLNLSQIHTLECIQFEKFPVSVTIS